MSETHEQRIARLTELARKVWPTVSNLCVVGGSDSAGAFESGDQQARALALILAANPRALDALEAALCVLADEVPQWVSERADELERDAAASKAIPGQGILSRYLRKLRVDLLERAKGQP